MLILDDREDELTREESAALRGRVNAWHAQFRLFDITADLEAVYFPDEPPVAIG